MAQEASFFALKAGCDVFFTKYVLAVDLYKLIIMNSNLAIYPSFSVFIFFGKKNCIKHKLEL